MFGFINVYKPVEMTSHDVVATLRRVTGFKHIGHAGTLDPFAEGVLPILIGTATKLSDYLSDSKEYVATLQFGAETDTYDKCGKIVYRSDTKINREKLEIVTQNFIGVTEQIPPIYSAIKLNGKKLYEYARNGETVELPKRQVKINSIEIVEFDEDAQTAKLLISCIKGTYIRSLAKDIGARLACGAYLTNLVRTVSGQFKVENSVKLSELNDITAVKNYLLNPINVLTDYEQLELEEFEYNKIIHGNGIKNRFDTKAEVCFLVYENKICATAKLKDDLIYPNKVLSKK